MERSRSVVLFPGGDAVFNELGDEGDEVCLFRVLVVAGCYRRPLATAKQDAVDKGNRAFGEKEREIRSIRADRGLRFGFTVTKVWSRSYLTNEALRGRLACLIVTTQSDHLSDCYKAFLIISLGRDEISTIIYCDFERRVQNVGRTTESSIHDSAAACKHHKLNTIRSTNIYLISGYSGR